MPSFESSSAYQRHDLAFPVGQLRRGARPTGGSLVSRPANSPISCLVTLGESSASPLGHNATAWTSSSGSVSFTRNPLASGADRLEHDPSRLEGREDHDPDAKGPVVGHDPPGRLQAVDPRHADVHHHQIGRELDGQPRRRPRRRLPPRRPRCPPVRRAATGSRRARAPGRPPGRP